mmetsp:Transcript_25463/g.75269  ORF Transcript_25463/g.75269 Transcript_25463/m.75269 type:complete len:102 (-) Transcript_25463:392-697(-)
MDGCVGRRILGHARVAAHATSSSCSAEQSSCSVEQNAVWSTGSVEHMQCGAHGVWSTWSADRSVSKDKGTAREGGPFIRGCSHWATGPEARIPSLLCGHQT